MATRFAISSGNFNNTAIWDNGAVPLSTDDIYSNGFSIAVNQNISAISLRSTTPNVYLPNMNIPAMTSNTQPSGIVESSGNAGTLYPYLVFDQNSSTSYGSNTNNTCWITYEYPSAKLIKRYYLKSIVVGGYGQPASWNFEGWNGTSWDLLEGKTGMGTSTQTGYTSPVLTHTTLYSKYRLNVTVGSSVGFPVSISQLEMTESTGTIYGTGTGGSFAITDSKDITLSGTQGLFSGSGSVYVLNVNTISPNVVNINCGTNFLSYLATGEGSAFYLSIAGSGTTNVTGNVYRTMNGIVSSTTTGIVNITGTITSGARGSSPVGCVILSGSATYNITGSLLGDPISSVASGWAVTYTGTGILNINGIITANSTEALSLGGTGTTNITGAITGSAKIAVSGGTSFVNILTGTITAGTGNNAISNTTTGLYTLGNSPLINTNNNMAVYSARIRLYSTAQVQWLFQNSAGTNTTLYSAGASLGLPLTTNVRYPVQYGASNELTGQLVMPIPSNVRVGVPTDNTVGTGQLTAADFLAAIAVSSDPVAERLRTVSTVDTTGDQIAAFNV